MFKGITPLFKQEEKSDLEKLEDVLAWLLLNSMRSEHLQHMQLCQQCLHNVWRRRAFARRGGRRRHASSNSWSSRASRSCFSQ